MADNAENRFLPVGSTISFKGQNLLVKSYLASGFTGIIYAGELDSAAYQEKRPVAIKVFKQSAGAGTLDIAMDEDENLDQLMDLEAVQDDYTEAALKIAPIYYGSDSYQSNEYLVMELLHGAAIPTILSNGKSFTEEQALKIAWQFYQFLEILHVKLKKTIFDFKPDNFWWTESNGGQLRILDLGGLPPLQEDARFMGNPRLDILRGAAFLFQVMTGRPLFVPLSQVIEDVRPILKNSSLSWGLRELLVRYLHPNPAFRCTAAVDAKQAFFDIFDFWQKPDAALQAMATENLADFEASPDRSTDECRGQARRARLLLGIIEKRNSQPDPMVMELIKQADQALEAASYFRTGVNLFNNAAYADACDQFRTGLAFAEEKKKHRDWLLLASIPKEIPAGSFTDLVRQPAVKAVEQMVEGRYSTAYETLREIQHVPSASLDSLLTECEIFLTLSAAQDYAAQNLFDDSIKEYEKILKAFKSLPADSSTLLNDIGDVETLLDDQKDLKKTLGRAVSLTKDAKLALQANENDKALTLFRESWACYPQTDFHADLFCSTLQTFLGLNDLAYAASLADLMRLMPAKPPAVQLAIDQAGAWISAYHFFNQQDMPGFLTSLGQMHTCDFVSPVPHNGFETFLRTRCEELRQRKDGEALSLLKPCVDEWFPASTFARDVDVFIAESNEKKIEKLRLDIDEAIRRKILIPMYVANPGGESENASELSPSAVLHFNADQLENLKKIQPEIDDILKLAGSIHYQEEYLQQLKSRVAGLVTSLQSGQSSTSPEKPSDSDGAARLREEWKTCQDQQNELLELVKSQFTPQSYRSLRMDFVDRLKDVYTRAYVLSVDDPHPGSEVFLILQEANTLLKQYGQVGWQQLQSVLDQQIASFQEDLKKVKDVYSQGDIQAASAWVDLHKGACRLDPALASFYDQVLSTTAFLAWKNLNLPALLKCEYDQKLVSDAWCYSLKPIDATYWKTPELHQYFLQVQDVLFKWLMDNYSLRTYPEYLQRLKQLMVVRKLFLHIQNSGVAKG